MIVKMKSLLVSSIVLSAVASILAASIAFAADSSGGNTSGNTSGSTSKSSTTDSQGATNNSAAAAAAEDWRKTPPTLPAPHPFKLPKIEKYKLANGLTVELVEDHRVPFTTLGLGIKVGTSDDPAGHEGLATLLSGMLNEGTQKHSSKEIAEEVDFIGGAFAANSGQDYSVMSCSALSQYNDRLVGTVSDMVLNPSIPESELKLNITNTMEELAMSRSKPDFLANERFAKVVYGTHPYSIIAPKPESIEKITRAQLLDFHKQHYVPNEAYLVVVGDFKSDEMKSLIEKDFGVWKAGAAAKPENPAMPHQSGRKIYLVDRPESVQSRIKMGNISLKKTDPDFYPLTVANQILGGAATARLFMNIREGKGYTYGAYSRIAPQRQPGLFSAEAEVRTDVTAPALQEFIYELERIRNLKPTDKELSNAKNYLVGAFQLGLETQSGLATRLLEGEIYGLPADYLEKYGDKILAVNADDVRHAARKYVDLDNLVVTVVGDAKKIKGELEFFAPVSVYDTSGNPKAP